VATQPGEAAPERRPATPPLPDIHRVIGNRYRLLEKLGEGGMATVFRAKDQELGQEIAIKIMHAWPFTEAWLARFRQELALARELTHKNIVRVFDIGSDGDWRFISMELLRGRSLDEIMLASKGVPLALGVHYMVQACAGLRAAHDRGIIHRDVKPGNMFVTKDGVLKLMDFGVAKGEERKGITRAGVLVGTPEYMSPEQIEDSNRASPRSDLYSLGVVMYELFTGSLPFEHAQLLALMRAHAEVEPPPLRAKNPAVPEGLERVVLRLLEKDPEKRHGNATEVARELRDVAREIR
jgi:serine/threonine-protein kinase